MNFNFIAFLFAVCASFSAAATEDQQEKLVVAPPVRHSKASSKASSSRKAAGSSSKVISSSHKASAGSHRTRPNHSVAPRSASTLQLSSEVHESSKACSRQLEGILYSPPSTVKDYLAGIANEMRTDIQVIMAAFAGGNLDYLRVYVVRYNILITVAGPYGVPVLVSATFNAATVPFKNVAFAQTMVGRDGFYTDPVNNYYNYQFSMMSATGQYITFVLSLPLSAMANSPTNC